MVCSNTFLLSHTHTCRNTNTNVYMTESDESKLDKNIKIPNVCIKCYKETSCVWLTSAD